MRVIDAEHLDPFSNPEKEDVAKGCPELFPLLAFKVDREDVFVALWRILCKLHRTVWTPDEPFRVFPDPWMVWRTLESYVESNLYP